MREASPFPADAGTDDLAAADRRDLLRLAREAVVGAVRGTAAATTSWPQRPPFTARWGAFVTLTSPDGSLRGCIGRFPQAAGDPLAVVVRRSAADAALHDPRFPPVRNDELDALTLSVSVIPALQATATPPEFQLGRHGLAVAAYGRHGTLLPHVALENGLDAPAFVAAVAGKAGLTLAQALSAQARWRRYDVIEARERE